MKFEVLKVNKNDIANNFFVGEVFQANHQIISENSDYTEEIIWDEINSRGITPEKVRALQ